jgi:eukaryotic-like serine/threonine-protein kinase
MSLHAGQRITRYRLLEPIGEGGMGVVWRAEDTELHRSVALKFLNQEAIEDQEMEARFLREARTAASLNHPGICTIYEVGRYEPGGIAEASSRFIAMELVPGRTLQSVLRERGRLPLRELLDSALQISEALAAAHAAGIVHRDLKPGNVMITPDDRAKILDFGLAKPGVISGLDGGTATRAQTISAEVTREGKILGTVAYISPEQAEGKPVDSRSDLFSFGTMLYEMTAGRLPFQGDTPTSTLAKVLEAEPEPLSKLHDGVPSSLSRIVERCLRKRPDDRYGDTGDLVAAIRSVRDDRHSDPVARVRPTEGAAPRRSKVGPALLTIAVVLAVAAAFVLWRFTGEQAVRTDVVPSVAVLPFENLSAEADSEYFAAGMTEEIISKLSRIQGLQVASRTSVAPYKDAERDVRRIGEELGVRYLLDGSVRRAGKRVRINAQLVDSETGFQVWSQEFEGTLEDVFEIQERTALLIAERLDLQLSPQEQRDVQQRGTENPEAYDSYLRAQVLLTDWSDREKVETARRHLEEALEMDPDYPLALAGLASVDAQAYRNFDPDPERLARAERNAARAVQLAPDLPRTQMALAETAAMRYDYAGAARVFRELTRLTPDDAFVWDLLSWALAYQQPPDPAGAIEAAREALRLQPSFPGAYYHLGRGLLLEDRNEEARDAFERALEQNPEFTAGHSGLMQYHLAVGEHDAALEEMELSDRDTPLTQYYAACIHSDRGDLDRAHASLESALRGGFRDFANIEASPYLAALRADPRYQGLVAPYRDR